MHGDGTRVYMSLFRNTGVVEESVRQTSIATRTGRDVRTGTYAPPGFSHPAGPFSFRKQPSRGFPAFISM